MSKRNVFSALRRAIYMAFPFQGLIFARLPTVAKDKLTCLRRKGSQPYFTTTGVSHILWRLNRWDVLEYSIAHAYNGNDRARDHADR